MAMLIKSAEALKSKSVRTLQQAHSDADGYVLKETAEAAELRILQAENLQLKAALLQAEIDAKQAVGIAIETTRTDTQATFERDEVLAQQALEAGIQVALSTYAQRLDALEGLSLMLSQTALEKIFTPSDDYRERVERMIALQMQGLRSGTVLSISVSELDFKDETGLQNIVQKIGASEIKITRDITLSAGQCHLHFNLGKMELSVQDHWHELLVLFEKMAHVGDV